MEKRSYKQAADFEKDYAGCLSGLASMFDSRLHLNSQKLLSERKHCRRGHSGTGDLRRKLDLPSYMEMVHEDIDDVNESEAKLATWGTASVRTLMEEEMSRTHNPSVSNRELDRVQSDLGLEIHLKRNHNKENKKHNVDSYLQVNNLRFSSNFDSSWSNSVNQTASPSVDFDFIAFMVEFYSVNYHCQEKQDDSKIKPCSSIEDIDHGKHSHLSEPDFFHSQKHSSLEKTLGEIADIFQHQKFIDSKLATDEQVQSKEFMDALEILNCNKELFCRLIQDQKSLLLKHIRNAPHRDKVLPKNVGGLGVHEEALTEDLFQKQIGNRFFRKKDKPKETRPLKGRDSSQAKSKIVVLKPSFSGNQNASTTESPSSSTQSYQGVKYQKNKERLFSNFSFQKLKRRLRRVIGESKKHRHAIFIDGNGILHGSKRSGNICEADANESNVSTSKTSCNAEATFQPPTIARKRGKKSKQKEVGLPTHRGSFFYEEAKKHLTEILAPLDETDSLPDKEASEQLQKILPQPEYEESELSPQEIGICESQEVVQENSMGHLCPLRQSSGAITACSGSNVYETQVMESTLVCTRGDLLNSKGTSKILELSDVRSTEEQDSLDILLESNGNEPNIKSERYRGEGSCTIFELEASDDKLEIQIPSASISSLLHIKELENLEEILETPERPSPVSVLEAVLPEDILSPRSTTIDNHVDFHEQPQKVHSEEHGNSTIIPISSGYEGDVKRCLGDKKDILSFMTKLLEASGLNCNETSERWHLSDQPVDPSLFQKLANSFSLLHDDPYLLSDYIYEVVVETQERLFGCTPWISIIKPGIRLILTKNLIREVCKSIDRHLSEQQFPNIPDELDDIWMDLQLDTNDVVMEMTDDILEEIIDGTVFELWI